MNETFYGWVFTGVIEEGEEYTQSGPTTLTNDEDIHKFIVDNITTYPEIRLVDGLDCCVMHIVRQQLIFPLPEGITTPPVWDAAANKFVRSPK